MASGVASIGSRVRSARIWATAFVVFVLSAAIGIWVGVANHGDAAPQRVLQPPVPVPRVAGNTDVVAAMDLLDGTLYKPVSAGVFTENGSTVVYAVELTGGAVGTPPLQDIQKVLWQSVPGSFDEIRLILVPLCELRAGFMPAGSDVLAPGPTPAQMGAIWPRSPADSEQPLGNRLAATEDEPGWCATLSGHQTGAQYCRTLPSSIAAGTLVQVAAAGCPIEVPGTTWIPGQIKMEPPSDHEPAMFIDMLGFSRGDSAVSYAVIHLNPVDHANYAAMLCDGSSNAAMVLTYDQVQALGTPRSAPSSTPVTPQPLTGAPSSASQQDSFGPAPLSVASDAATATVTVSASGRSVLTARFGSVTRTSATSVTVQATLHDLSSAPITFSTGDFFLNDADGFQHGPMAPAELTIKAGTSTSVTLTFSSAAKTGSLSVLLQQGDLGSGFCYTVGGKYSATGC